MKRLLCSVILAIAFLSAVQAQNKIFLELEPRLGTAPFGLNIPVSAGSYDYKISRLEYYISEIKITHDGGQITPMTDLHLLSRPAGSTVYELGEFPTINAVESIAFAIGVDSAFNHLDPTLYTDKHPLAPQNPSMHWGWVSGYRFVVIEGKAGANFINDFEIHALGDENYQTLSINTGAETLSNGDKRIHLIADYAQVLAGVDVEFGEYVHSSTHHVAIKVLENMNQRVFRAATSATTNPAFEGKFSLAPNPAIAGHTTVNMTLPVGSDYRISLTDLTGRVLLSQPVSAAAQTFIFENLLNPGAYLIQLWQNERPVAVEKLIVVQ